MIFKYLTKNFYINSLIIFLVYSLDRVSKLYIIYLNKNNLDADILTSTYLNITLVWNRGIAFGLFSFNRTTFYNGLSTLIAFVILILIVMAIKNSGLKRYSLLIIIGGALGNLHDRIFFYAVPDFIDFHIGDFHWFIFNVSDIFITIGVIGMIILELIDNNKNNVDKKI
jgi:signal peptidase II